MMADAGLPCHAFGAALCCLLQAHAVLLQRLLAVDAALIPHLSNHPERGQIRIENVFCALGNPLRLAIVRQLGQAKSATVA